MLPGTLTCGFTEERRFGLTKSEEDTSLLKMLILWTYGCQCLLRLNRSRGVKVPKTAAAQWRQGPSLQPDVQVQTLALPVPKPPVPGSLGQVT